MKKNLLVTTALVAAFMTSNALADEYIRNQEQLNNIDTSLASIKFDNTNGKLDAMEEALTLNDNLELNGQVTLHDQVTLTGDKTLTVNGWLTQTASGSNVSGVDVVVNEGGLTLGNDLTVGDMTIGDEADIALYNIGSDASDSLEKVLNVTEGSVLYFGGTNEIRDSGQSTTKGNTLTINADNALVTFDTKDLNKNGALTLGSDVTINGKATLHTKTSVTGGKNLTVNGWLTQSASGSDVSDVNVAVNDGGLVLGNDLTVGNMTIDKGADVVLYTTDEVAETIGKYADSPEKTLNVENTLTFASDSKIRDYKSSTKTGSLIINGGNVVNEGALTVSAATTFENVALKNNGTIEGSFTLNGGSYGFDVKEDATSDAKVNGTITLVGSVNLDVDVSNVTSAEKLTFAEAVTVTGDGEWTHNLTNNIFNVSISEGRNALEFAAKSAEDIAADTGASGSQAAGVNAIISGGTEDTGNASFEAVAGEVQSLMQSSNKADVAKALEMVDKMSSDLSNAVTASVVANNAQVLAAVGSRFTGGNVAPAQQGMSSGDSWFEKGAAWIQGLFNKSKLDTSNGFEADSEGIAFGFEKIVNDGNAKVGLGYAYSTSDIDADSRDVDADTHTLMVYGEYKPADWFVNGVLSYSFGDYDETSSIKSEEPLCSPFSSVFSTEVSSV